MDAPTYSIEGHSYTSVSGQLVVMHSQTALLARPFCCQLPWASLPFMWGLVAEWVAETPFPSGVSEANLYSKEKMDFLSTGIQDLLQKQSVSVLLHDRKSIL